MDTDQWRNLYQLWMSFLNAPGQVQDLNLDMVTYPQSKALLGVGQRVDSPYLAITSSSTHKDEAFEVIATILSDAVQTDLSKHGKMTVLKDQTIKKQFGSDTQFNEDFGSFC